MRVRVHFAAQLRTAVGRSLENVELAAGSTVAALVEQLAAQLDGAAPHLVAPSGQPHRSLIIVVNNSAVCSSRLATTELAAGDVVILLPPIAGG